MKTFRNLFLGVAMMFCGGVAVTSCTDYQDEIDALDVRVTYLESLVNEINRQLDALEVVINALKDADYITGVKEDPAGGYVINFAKKGPVYISDGIDGIDGKDAEMPEIKVEKGGDGDYYWVIDGEYLTDDGTPTGNRIRVNGKDGKDAISPQVRINPDTYMWEVSPDGGKTWTSTGTSCKGKDGTNGTNGKDGNTFFSSVKYEVNGSEEYMAIETTSGQTFKIPIYKNK